MKQCVFITVAVLSFFVETLQAEYRVPSGWRSQKICQLRDSRNISQNYCLEILELETGRIRKNKTPPLGSILLIPGLFQNVYVFDPSPGNNVSFARYLAKEFHYRIFVLHVRGIGNSDYPKNSSLDDIAIDDIPQAIAALKSSTGGSLYVLGHSQGAITLQASLAGLTRNPGGKNKKEFFDEAQAHTRQNLLGGVGLLTGNVAMTATYKQNLLHILAPFGIFLEIMPTKLLDRIPAESFTKSLSAAFDLLPFSGNKKDAIVYSPLWSFLYNPSNVIDDVKNALYKKTLDSSTTAILRQFADGISQSCIRTRNSGIRYCDYLKNIKLRLFQVTFSLDPLAEPQKTFEDSFARIGSPHKTIVTVEGQGHEDFLLSRDLHGSFYNELVELLR